MTAIKGLNQSVVWIGEHAALYRGKWVAVADGHLLGVEDTRQKLIEELGNQVRAGNVIVTKIP